jgi:hypothetical protein
LGKGYGIWVSVLGPLVVQRELLLAVSVTALRVLSVAASPGLLAVLVSNWV